MFPMPIAISIMSKVIPFIKKYWELALIIFLVIAFGIYIMKLKRDVASHVERVVELREQVAVLEVSNQTLIKNFAFYMERIRLLEVYSNSGRMINRISNFQLSSDLRNVLNTIEGEYVSIFPKLKLTNVLDIDDVVQEIAEARAEEEMRMKVENYPNIEAVETIPEMKQEVTNEANS